MKKSYSHYYISILLVNLRLEISFRKLISTDQAIKHSGDDLTGDLNGDDGLDNEVITLDLSRLNASANYVAFFINSFSWRFYIFY